MAINNIVNAIRNSMCDAFVDAIDAGSPAGAGTLKIYTASFTTLLATLTFNATAFGGAASGVATAQAITSETSVPAAGTNTAAVFRVEDSTPTTLFEGTVGTSGQDINFNTDQFTQGDSVAITSMTVTMPAS